MPLYGIQLAAWVFQTLFRKMSLLVLLLFSSPTSSSPFYPSPLLAPSLFYSLLDLLALSTNISCQSIPSEIPNGIVPSDDITRRFCIFHRTLTIRTAMKLSSTNRYMRVDTEKKLVGTWPGSR